MPRLYRALSSLLPILALMVVIKGAYVRLSDAGLGCPDWPGCYGRLVVPKSASDLPPDNRHLAQRPLEKGKAWREMIHRYLASSLGLGILVLGIYAWRHRRLPSQPVAIPLLLMPLVLLQGLLGMWTVTLLLKPLIVISHLLGGLSILALLWWNLLTVRQPPGATTQVHGRLTGVAVLALVVLVLQLFLGGWTSANYAALACTDFPSCQGSWWPRMDFGNAFVLWRGLGVNYEYGVLETAARTAIHFSHRLWAGVTTVVILGAVSVAFSLPNRGVRRTAWCILAALTVQVALGITNVLHGLPLPVAVAHNAVAAILLLTLVTLLFNARHYQNLTTRP